MVEVLGELPAHMRPTGGLRLGAQRNAKIQCPKPQVSSCGPAGSDIGSRRFSRLVPVRGELTGAALSALTLSLLHLSHSSS